MRDQRLAVLVEPAMAFAYVTLIRNCSRDLVALLHGKQLLDPVDAERFVQPDIPVLSAAIDRIEALERGGCRVVFETGETLNRDAIFHLPPQAPRNDLAQALDCDLVAQGMLAGMITVQTSVAGVHAAGDISTPGPSISMAVATGMRAAQAAHHALASESIAAELETVEAEQLPSSRILYHNPECPGALRSRSVQSCTWVGLDHSGHLLGCAQEL